MRVKGWSGRSRLAKVDLYSRGTVYLILWTGVLMLVALLLSDPVRRNAPVPLVAAGPVLALAEGVVCARLARHAMDAYLGQGRVSRKLLCWSLAMTAAALTLAGVLASMAGPDLLATALAMGLIAPAAVHALLVPVKVTALIQSIGAALLFALFMAAGMTAWQSLFSTLFIGFMAAWMAFGTRASMWILSVMWELREARDVQARLAVAEERLRFGRDLHDVMGRNLAVVALKSELAVQLSRRGRPEAVDQMLEVQRIARETQREVREVVRGYREADLKVELEGARGVLDAAGIACTVVVGELELRDEVRSALGWVVREATTNVLRHGDTRRCTISLGAVDGAALLIVENDGAAQNPPGAAGAGTGSGVAGSSGTGSGVAGSSDAGPGVTGITGSGFDSAGRPGSGLAGLRERLSAVGGVLEAGHARPGHFRLTARVPLSALPVLPVLPVLSVLSEEGA
ncbi:sensor histidine kinase [Streptomyces inusitatus]|uniref:sensor histidine kinase n=1 Tax=Streptomyces inusitatus TaxID=68221 RepID=UPI001E2F2495|nr:histidine kinase [Streptomyces inusitatus]